MLRDGEPLHPHRLDISASAGRIPGMQGDWEWRSVTRSVCEGIGRDGLPHPGEL